MRFVAKKSARNKSRSPLPNKHFRANIENTVHLHLFLRFVFKKLPNFTSLSVIPAQVYWNLEVEGRYAPGKRSQREKRQRVKETKSQKVKESKRQRDSAQSVLSVQSVKSVVSKINSWNNSWTIHENSCSKNRGTGETLCQLEKQKQKSTPCAWCKMTLTSHWCCSRQKLPEASFEIFWRLPHHPIGFCIHHKAINMK